VDKRTRKNGIVHQWWQEERKDEKRLVMVIRNTIIEHEVPSKTKTGHFEIVGVQKENGPFQYIFNSDDKILEEVLELAKKKVISQVEEDKSEF
jgi:phosphopentomutase